MRIAHLVFGVFCIALLLAIAREEVGRVALVVFFTGLAEFIFGVTAVMSLFQTVAMIGHANRPIAYLQGVAATALVLLIATAAMNAALWVGWWLLTIILPEPTLAFAAGPFL